MFACSVGQSGRGSPWVTSTDGTNNVIVWVAGVAGDQRLHGYNGDTGAVVYSGGGSNELMRSTRQWNTGVVARGRIYFGADNKVYAFAVPAGTPTPTPTATPSSTATATATSTADSYVNAYYDGTTWSNAYANLHTSAHARCSTGAKGNQRDCQQFYCKLEFRKRRDWLPVGCLHEFFSCHFCVRVREFGRQQHDESKCYRADQEHVSLLPVTRIQRQWHQRQLQRHQAEDEAALNRLPLRIARQ